ncbi:MAG: transporter substrate-binding domain-containing protein [Acidobacteria bacterium]|nr:transporter substrate-binding domain-containing protein [Acidobacteriota bacterium]
MTLSPGFPIARALIALGLALVSLACGGRNRGKVELSQGERDWLRAHPVVRVAPIPDYAPLEWIDAKGRVQGVTPDLLKLLEARSGLRFEYLPAGSWQEALDLVKAGKADCVDLAAPTEERKEYLAFTRSYMEIPDVVVVNEDWTGPTTLDGLVGHRMVVVRGYAVNDWMRRKHPGIIQVEVPDLLTGLRRVSFGGGEAMVVNLAPATYHIREQKITNLKVVSDSGFYYRLGFGVRKDLPELLGIIDKTLATLTEGEVEAISGKWFEVRARWRPSPLQWAALAGGLVLVAAASGLAWIWTLRIQVRERTEALRLQLAQQKRLEERQEAFVVMITHELRTPLTAVKGAMDLLAGAELDDTRKRELVRISKDNADRLVLLVNDLLDLERFGAGAVDLEVAEVDPANLLREVTEACQTYASPLGVRIQVEPGDPDLPACPMDGRRMAQVLFNLLSNAIKHSPEGGVVRLHAGREDGWLRIEVWDEGAGIPKELVPRLFEPFIQGEIQGRGPKGTGLGLAISRALVELHQGRIGVECGPAGGSRFFVLLPLAPGAAQT